MIPHRRKKFVSNWFAKYMRYRIFKAFNRVVVLPFTPKEGHSVLLLCNHFSWWDGFLANYLSYWHLNRKFHVMMQRDHLEKRMFFNLIGGFSIEKGARDMIESLNYAAELCNDPQNQVVVFPQGALISNHSTEIEIGMGIERLIKRIKGPCQIVYNCVLIDYFESLKPSAFIHLFDCGVAGEVPFAELVQNINGFHQQALKDQVNVEH
jgi:1-acyl-sn-glycerol-3-phosphate acyltransferase